MSHATPPPDHWAEQREKNRSDGSRKRTFTVVGPHTVHGKNKGETLTVELTDSQADVLISAGHVVEKLYEPEVFVKASENTEVSDVAVVKSAPITRAISAPQKKV